MKKTRKTPKLRSGLIALLLIIPGAAMAEVGNWEFGRDQLQWELKPGQERRFYARKLDELGYAITAINAYEANYLEYETVKEGLTYEVQLDVDEDTDKIINVEIDDNAYQTSGTKWAIGHYNQKHTSRLAERERSEERDFAQLQWELQPGEDRRSYEEKLKTLGYQITAINALEDDYLEYEVVKDNRSYEIQIDLDEKTKRATDVEIEDNWWETDTTEQVLAASTSDQQRQKKEAQAIEVNRASARSPRAVPVRQDASTQPVEETADRQQEQSRHTEMNQQVEREQKNQQGEETVDAKKRWGQEKTVLQKALPADQERDAYLTQLNALGYLITSANYNDPDYLEYEVVKDGLTYEVQIDVDEDTGKATQVVVVENTWQTDATEQALARHTQVPESVQELAVSRSQLLRRASQHSDRDQSGMQQLVAELQTLPLGETQVFYENALKERNYQIVRMTHTPEKAIIEATKNNRGVILYVFFDEKTGKSVRKDPMPLWWNLVEIDKGSAVEHADTLGLGWATAPEDRKEQLFSREVSTADAPALTNLDKNAVRQEVMSVLKNSLSSEAQRNIKVDVQDDGGVILDGTVKNLGAAAAAYSAASTVPNARYIIVDLDIQGKQFQQERANRASQNSAPSDQQAVSSASEKKQTMTNQPEEQSVQKPMNSEAETKQPKHRETERPQPKPTPSVTSS